MCYPVPSSSRQYSYHALSSFDILFGQKILIILGKLGAEGKLLVEIISGFGVGHCEYTFSFDLNPVLLKCLPNCVSSLTYVNMLHSFDCLGTVLVLKVESHCLLLSMADLQASHLAHFELEEILLHVVVSMREAIQDHQQTYSLSLSLLFFFFFLG